MPENFDLDDSLIIEPFKGSGEIKRGPNIKPFPRGTKMENNIGGKVLIKLGDNITTDHIMPSNANLLPFRSNVPYLSEYCLVPCDSEFPKLAKEFSGGFVVAGSNYGQGSSREHAALAPLYLGVKAVLSKSFARIHRANLINSGIIPMVFEKSQDYDDISKLDDLLIKDLNQALHTGSATVQNLSKCKEYRLEVILSDEEKDMIKYGGYLNYISEKSRA
jgi:aconitate hydratase